MNTDFTEEEQAMLHRLDRLEERCDQQSMEIRELKRETEWLQRQIHQLERELPR